MKPINKVVIHCSDTPVSMDIGVKDIDLWHRERGFDSVGYHWVIRRDGTLEEGRSESTPGAHAYGHNQDSIGVCMVGGKPDCNYTAAQWRCLEALVKDLLARYPGSEVIGHRDVSDKPCPMFNAKAWAASL